MYDIIYATLTMGDEEDNNNVYVSSVIFKLILGKKSTSLPHALIVLLRVGVDETRDSGGDHEPSK